jgi:hypothetical protein
MRFFPLRAAKPAPLADRKLLGGNLPAIRDLIEAVEEDRRPLANRQNPLRDSRRITSRFP